MDKGFVRKLSGNQLKIIAAISMTIDHIGVIMFPDIVLLRIIGRLAMPIFAYMIAEGCAYTKNKKKYILLLLSVALLCQVVYFVASRGIAQSIMTTFLMSVLLIFSFEKVRAKENAESALVFALVLLGSFLTCTALPNYLKGFSIDYGFFGVVLPLLVYMGRDRKEKLLLCAAGQVMLAVTLSGVQAWSLFSLIPLFFYDGTRGKARLKYFFYVYFPLHLGIIYLISIL